MNKYDLSPITFIYHIPSNIDINVDQCIADTKVRDNLTIYFSALPEYKLTLFPSPSPISILESFIYGYVPVCSATIKSLSSIVPSWVIPNTCFDNYGIDSVYATIRDGSGCPDLDIREEYARNTFVNVLSNHKPTGSIPFVYLHNNNGITISFDPTVTTINGVVIDGDGTRCVMSSFIEYVNPNTQHIYDCPQYGKKLITRIESIDFAYWVF